MGTNYVESSLKRFLKRKVKVTLGLVVAFMITGTVSFSTVEIGYKGDKITVNGKTEGDITEGKIEGNKWINDKEIKSEVVLNNEILTSGIALDIENNGTISADDRDNTGNANGITIFSMGIDGETGKIINTGIISGNSEKANVNDIGHANAGNGIGVYSYYMGNGNLNDIENTGIITGVVKNTSEIQRLSSTGNGIGIFSLEVGIENVLGSILNKGTISGYAERNDDSFAGDFFSSIGNGISIFRMNGEGAKKIISDFINNTGIIKGSFAGIDAQSNNTLLNAGNGVGIFNYKTRNIENDDAEILINDDITNTGIIKGNVTEGTLYYFSVGGNGLSLHNHSDEHEGNKMITLNNISNNGAIIGNVTGKIIEHSNGGNGLNIYNYCVAFGKDDKSSGMIALNNISNSGTITGNVTGEITELSHGGNGLNVYNFNDSYNNAEVTGKITLNDIANTGLIIGSEKGVYLHDVTMTENFNNYGIVGGKNAVVIEDKDGAEITGKDINYGLYLTFDETDKNIVTEVKSGTANSTKAGDYTIINAFETDINDTAKIEEGTINSSDLNSLDNSKLILNGVYNTLTVNEDLKLSDSIINGYKTAVHITDGVFHGNNITVNGGGLDRETPVIKGDEGENTLILEGNSQINGNIDMGTGEDKIFFEKGNMNLYHSISGAEKITFNNNTTLFEETKIEGAKNIYIGDNAELALRVNALEKETGTDKITGHALYGNDGTIISSSKDGTLKINFIGGQNENIISFGDNILKDIVVDFTNPLYMTEETSSKDETSEIKVQITENLDNVIGNHKTPSDLDVSRYEKLNKIYKSMHSVNALGTNFTGLTDEKIGEFLAYLNDIYAVNPYAYSSELSRKSMSMFKDSALSKDLMPDVKKWAVYGGLTHVDGGTKDTFYGKEYYTYDIGSRDVEADSKITGAFAQFEYGKSETVKTGFIFGGNNSETEIGASKVKGDSFYFGAFAKKYINDFRFTVGAGFEHGDYKGDRTALGYGITDTRSYSENYHDRGFNIYGDVRYSKDLGNSFYFEPSLNIEYSYVDQDGVSEKGKDLSIETDSRYFDYAAAELNLEIKKIIPMETAKHIFTAGASYERFLTGYDEEFITGRMKDNGTDFDILVPEKEKDNFALNIKYEFEKENGFIFDVKGQYRFEHGNNEKEWIVGTGIGYKF